jgi:hypothetical protein
LPELPELPVPPVPVTFKSESPAGATKVPEELNVWQPAGTGILPPKTPIFEVPMAIFNLY